MIEQFFVRLVESPHRRTIITTVCFGLILTLVLPLVDQYFDLQDQRAALRRELARARQEAASVDQFAARVETALDRLTEVERRTVSEAELPEFRSQLVKLVRDTGCQIRRIQTGTSTARPWHGAASDAGEAAGRSAQFQLQTLPVSLSVTGSAAKVRRLLEGLQSRGDITQTRKLVLRPADPQRTEVVLELELLLFDLARAAEA